MLFCLLEPTSGPQGLAPTSIYAIILGVLLLSAITIVTLLVTCRLCRLRHTSNCGRTNSTSSRYIDSRPMNRFYRPNKGPIQPSSVPLMQDTSKADGPSNDCHRPATGHVSGQQHCGVLNHTANMCLTFSPSPTGSIGDASSREILNKL